MESPKKRNFKKRPETVEKRSAVRPAMVKKCQHCDTLVTNSFKNSKGEHIPICKCNVGEEISFENGTYKGIEISTI